MAEFKCMDEDQVAYGLALAFPNIQTCIAAIAVLPNGLLGYHFTLSSLKRLNDARDEKSIVIEIIRDRSTWWLDRAKEYTGGSQITKLYLVGNTPGYNLHDLKAVIVRDINNGNDIPTYAYDIYSPSYKKHSPVDTKGGVTVFARHINKPTDAKIKYKRDDKVTVGEKKGRDVTVGARLEAKGITIGKLAGLNFNQTADIDCKNLHNLRRNFVTL